MNDKHFPDGIIIGKPNHEVVIREGIPNATGGVFQHGGLFVSDFLFSPGAMFQQENSVDVIANVGGGEDTLKTNLVPKDLLQMPGDTMKFTATGHVANSAGTKTIKMYLNLIEVASIVCGANAVLSWICEGEIVRIDATEIHVHVRLFDCDGTTGALGANWAEFHTDQAIATGLDIIMKWTGEAAGGGVNDVTQDMCLTFISMRIPT